MKSLRDYILEQDSSEEVYAVYYEDGTMENFYFDESEAKKVAEKLNKECPANNCTIKKEKKSAFES